MLLKQNVGPYDRAIRIAAGSAIAALGLFKRKTQTGKLMGIMGLCWAMEGFLGHCFFYDLVGISTKDET
ncbi:DUF2892 domain-containing protein [Thermoanaerobacterium sp. RBIITD]|uniref:YgaP family membrane protein n=1 Tax=Thermoanaerobacterium sp. RBIITD TaxID=1550240 RepID=UPI000BB81A2D|nr:DUF2892 domain-containing protein [Thermoanaerobacterium sp. RBIITD]SNX54744.1 Protein of unknown function [Thermoanaerobacterium sp. RBIITD]